MTISEDDDETPGGYLLGNDDAALLTLVARLLEQAMLRSDIDWAIKVSLAKLLHVVCRLPNQSSDLILEVTFSSPRERYGQAEVYFSLSVGADEGSLTIRYGGHYYHPGSGGDSFSVFAWSARPGVRTEWIDYSESLAAVNALVDPAEVLHTMPDSLGRCEIHVFDDDNSLLEDEPTEQRLLFTTRSSQSLADQGDDEARFAEEQVASEDDDEASRPLLIEPVTDSDRRLLAQIGPGNTYSTSAGDALGIENCDGCDVRLSTVGLFVDGSSPSTGWGNYCASCCISHGVVVGWGKGQLYAKQPDGRWKGIAGFRR